MKRIAIFCDGTWNRSDATHPTNVMRLARAIRRSCDDGIVQQVIYVAGVGSGRGTTWLGRMLDRTFGGGFGLGLSANIEEAYWHLAFNYEPGDQIYIFGFSRGAFTARSLAGLIRSCGIPPEENLRDIPKAMAAYQARGEDQAPDEPAPMAFRHAFSPLVATSQNDVDARTDTCELLTLAYLGVWDTVGSLGVPVQLGGLSRLWNRKYEFHDHVLSRSVRSARHAVAVDERRKNFMPTPWENVAQLNGARSGPDAPYQQLWFAGDHGSVGGGGDITALSAISLGWIADGAEAAGLEFDLVDLAGIAGEEDPFGPLRNSTASASLLTRVMRLSSADRPPPETAASLAGSTRKRLDGDPAYRPGTLEIFLDDLIECFVDKVEALAESQA